MYTLYGIKTCDTVKKARQWLDKHHLAHQFHDFRVDGLTSDQLKHFASQVDWNVLLNKSSTTWRQLSPDQQSYLSQEKALTLMLANPTLIKRPILDAGTKLLVGFKADTYSTELL